MGKLRMLILITAGVLAAGVTAHARETYNFNTGWRFFQGNNPTPESGVRVDLPHTWSSDALAGDREYYRGLGSYMKEANVPSEWRGSRVFIRFHGSNAVTGVFVNGLHVYEHQGGYNAFTYEITDYLQFGGKNAFWITVNNSPRSDVLPTGGDQNSYGGIFRDVEIIVTGREMVSLIHYGGEGVYVIQKSISAELVEAEAEILISGVRDNNVTAVLTIAEEDGRVVAQQSTKARLSGRTISTVRIPFSFPNPRLWNGMNDPYRYTVSVNIQADGAVTDSVSVKTGFRKIEVSPDGPFILNGTHYPVRGVAVTQDRSLAGPAINREQVREDFEEITEMGATMVRVLGVMHHPFFYELCDRYGILVWQDFPLMGGVSFSSYGYIDTEPLRDNGIFQANEIFRQLYNRPSVVMWGIFSNMHQRGENPVDFVSNLNLLTKREDPSRLTVCASNDDGEINFITDLVVWDHHFGWRSGIPSEIQIWKRQFQLNWNNLKSGIAWSAGASVYHQGDSLRRPNFLGNYHPERWQTHLHEQYYGYLNADKMFWGLFAGNMFDYGAAVRGWGEGRGINDLGLITFDRRYRKDGYYFFKANWNPYDPFVYIAERRWSRRGSTLQDIRAFTNRPEAELYVNGVPIGTAKTELGTVHWIGVELQEGANTLEVRSNELSDITVITVDPAPKILRGLR